jgi:hypothetical protein
VQLDRTSNQGILGFYVTGIWQTALHRAHRLTCLAIVETHALGAKVWIDDVDVVALRDGSVGTLGLASSAVDAVIGDARCHAGSL